MLLALFGVGMAWSAPQELLSYQAPQADLAALWRRYQPGEVIFAGADGTRLREAPSDAAAIRAELPLGEALRVVRVAVEGARLGEWAGDWLEVDTPAGRGFLFSGVASPLALQDDLDGDGVTERLVVTLGPSGVIRVRVAEPDGRTAALELPPAGVSCGPGYGAVTFDPHPTREAGHPLLHLVSQRPGCPELWDAWIAYGTFGERSPKLYLALQTRARFEPGLVITEDVKLFPGGAQVVRRFRQSDPVPDQVEEYRWSNGRFVRR